MFHKRARLDGQTEFTASCSESIPASYNAVIVSSSSKDSSEHKTDTSPSKDSSDDRVSKSNGHTADTEEGEEGARIPDHDEVLPGFKLDGGHLVPAMTTPVLSNSLSVGGNSSAAPVERPDRGVTNSLVTVRLRANSFLVEFQPLKQILRYTFDIPAARFSNAEPGEIMDKLIQENYGDAMPVHDSHKYIYSSELLPQGQFTVKLLQNPKRKSEMEYAVIIKLDGQFDGRCLTEKEKNQTFLQAVAVVLRENPRSQRFYMAGKGFLSKQEDMNEQNIGGGIFASKGFCLSLRVTARGLALHVGLSAVPLYRNISLVDYIRETISCTEFEPLSLKDIHDVERHLRGLEIITTHLRTPNIYRVRRLSSQAAVDLSSVIPMVGFVEHFKQKYDLDIRFKLWPCVDVSRNRKMPYYVPLEFCQICDGQRVSCRSYGSTELTRMHRCPPLAKRVEMIHDIMAKPDGPRGTHFTQFQITVAADMTEVTGRVLEPPLLKLGNGSHVRPRWDDRQWNLVKSHVFDGKRLENWGIITFSNGNDTTHRSRVEKLYHLLVRKCIDMGVYMNEKPLVCEYDCMEKFGDYFQLREIIDNIQTQTKGELQILICVIENGLPAGYNYLKFICDIEVGLITQCCLLQNVIRCSYPDEMKASQCLAGLVLKINAKVGGSNVALHKNSLCKSPGSGHSDPVLIIGAHITLGWLTGLPSTAAVVGSMNWPDCNSYLAKIKFQMLRSGKRYLAGTIEQVGEMCEELLKDYLRINKQLPRKIVFFRRGALSEGSRTLCNFEVEKLKKAISQLNLRCRPAISFTLTWRAKQIRLFPLEDQPRTRSGNVIPGTVVDTKIVHPSEFDFYLCSHYTHKGTAIPTCYHVIYDENAFTSDKLQKLVNNLCYTSGRCTKPVSLVAPIYYARLAARRGHQYAEAQSFQLPEAGSTLFSPPFELPEAIKENRFNKLFSPTFELPEAIKDAMFFC